MEKVLRLFGLRYATAALVLIALAALYGMAAFSRPKDRAGTAEKATPASVTSAVSVCPGHEGGRLSMQSFTAAGARPGGRANVTETRSGSSLTSLTSLGQGWSTDIEKAKDSFTVRADGAFAAGLETEQTTYWPKGDDRGLAGTRCASPGTDVWFMGPGPIAAESLDLYLTNVDSQSASVDVTALSGEGPLDTTDGRGTPVPPYTTRILRIGKSPEGLGDIVQSARDLALRVHTTSGRVSAALRVRIGKQKGIEWVPPSIQPASSILVPGVPSGSGNRQLLVAVPGEADARIKVQVLTPNGAFAPQGQDVLDAPAQSVTSVDLENALSGKPAAVRLVADRPIIAGFAAEQGADVAYGTATRPLGSVQGAGGMSSGVVADDRLDASLSLTAPDGAATVRVTAVGGSAPGSPQEIKIPAGRTIETRLAGPRGAEHGYGAVVTPLPGSAPVYAARTLTTGKGDGFLFTVLPIAPAVTTVWLPPAADSQSALIP